MTRRASRTPRPASALHVRVHQGVLILAFVLLYVLAQRHAAALFPLALALTGTGATLLLCAFLLAVCSVWLVQQRQTYPAHLYWLTTGVVWAFMATLLLMGTALARRRPSPEETLMAGLMLAMTLGFLVLVLSSRSYRLELQAQQGQAASLAERDALTGLLNRAGLRRAGETRLRQHALRVILLDINSLKRVNDVSGHGSGDAYLQQIAHVLSTHTPPDSLVGRWSGDEFLLLLPPTTNVGALMVRLLALVPHPQGRSQAFAYGAALAAQGTSLDQALASADEGMYEQKARLAVQDGLDGISYVQLQTFTAYLMSLPDMAALLSLGLRRCLQVTDFEEVVYFQLTDDLNFIQPVAWEAKFELPNAELSRLRLPVSGLTAEAVAQRQTRWDANFGVRDDISPQTRARGVRSALITPVLQGERVVGVLYLVTYTTWKAISPQNRLLLESLALHLGQALERQRQVDVLQHSLERSVRELGIVLEVRDLETAGHTDRVTQLALRFAQALHLGAQQAQYLRLGAYLHDVGKLSVPDRVLLKLGPLDAEERALINTHTLRGAELVQRLPSLPAEVVEVVLSHHERWDGAGYPHGLSGEGIPLLARMFAICDVYDALTSERPYKPAWTHAAAVAEIEAQAGRQFDPHLAQVFAAVVRERLV